jgi:hypothetical protein
VEKDMAEKVDFKKIQKALYRPPRSPVRIQVPEMGFIAVDGQGAPQGEDYQKALQTLYALTFAIKMSKMSATQPAGYFEYVVPPLEGLWWSEGGALDMQAPKESWRWTSMIRQPDFVDEKVFEWAQIRCREKKPEVDVSGARLIRFEEGDCVQMMHVGPYEAETCSIGTMKEFMAENGLRDETGDIRKHHEIYLSDPRKTAPEKLKTVIRLPVG